MCVLVECSESCMCTYVRYIIAVEHNNFLTNPNCSKSKHVFVLPSNYKVSTKLKIFSVNILGVALATICICAIACLHMYNSYIPTLLLHGFEVPSFEVYDLSKIFYCRNLKPCNNTQVIICLMFIFCDLILES